MLDCMIIKTDDIEPVVYEWGAVKWVANADLAPAPSRASGTSTSCRQDEPRALAHRGGEIVYMLQGECDVRVGDRTMSLVPGSDACHPQGVKHEVANNAGSRSSTCARSPRPRAARCSGTDGAGRPPVSGRSGQPW